MRATSEFEFHRELGKIGKPLDRDEWFMTPQTINAYYNPGFNEIVFPAAILQFPFFDATRDAAANYGAIGAVIGHEIGHGFDDQGSKYDGDGRLTTGGPRPTAPRSRSAPAALIEQYNALAPAPGARTTTSTARSRSARTSATWAASASRWKAYLLSLGRRGAARDRRPHRRASASSSPGRRPGSRRAATRRSSACSRSTRTRRTSSAATRSCATSTRSTTTFDVTEGDALWLAPEERVTIW